LNEATSQKEFEISLGMLMVTSQPAILSVSGMGSCVALTMRGKQTGTSGLAHIVLPASYGDRESMVTPGRYADTAVGALLRGLLNASSTSEEIVAKLAGGARVSSGIFDGYKNVESVRSELGKRGIAIAAEDVGLTYGRSVKFDTSTGKLAIRRYQQLGGIAELKDEITI
jgi:chemotaxis protein CheD